MKASEPIKAFQGNRESQLLIQQLTEHLDSALWVCNPDYSRFQYVSPAWEQVFGMPAKMVLKEAQSFLEVVHPEDRDRVEKALDREKSKPGKFNLKFRVVHADDSIHHLWTRTFPVPDETGQLYRVCGVAQDVTPLVEAQDAMRQSENNVRAILDNAPDAFVCMDAEGRVTEWNPEAERVFGWSHREAMGRTVAELFIPEPLRKSHTEGLKRYREGRESKLLNRRVEMVAVHKDGHDILVEMETLPIRTGDHCTFAAFINDITERKQNERRLELQYEVTALMAQAASLADTLPKILKCICEAMGWQWGAVWETQSRDNNLQCVRWWYGDPGLASFEQKSRQLTLKFNLDVPETIWNAEGPVWIDDITVDDNFVRKYAAMNCGLKSLLMLPLHAGGQVQGFIEFMGRESVEPHPRCIQTLTSLCSNIAQFVERKRAEELAAERGLEVRRFVAMLTHDLKTPLIAADRVLKAVIHGKSGKLTEEQTEVLSMVQKSNEELLHMVQRSLELYRQFGSFKRENLDVGGIIQESVDHFAHVAFDSGVTLKNDVHSKLPPVLGDGDAIRHLFTNLLDNALKFTPTGGEIHLTCATKGSAISVSIADSGVGIPSEELPYIFQPFWQGAAGRKRQGGNGLGLYLCRQIADTHGGSITCESKDGSGTIFTVRLPVNDST